MKRSTSWSAMSMGADGIMDAMDGSDGANGERTREAAEVSPSIAFNALALFTSYFLKFVLPDSPHVFATVTNVSFLLSAFYIQFRVTSVYDTDRESIKVCIAYNAQITTHVLTLCAAIVTRIPIW